MVWDEFVAWTVKNHLYGIENLSLIPGTVGASPVQNIGAYGVEAKESIISVEGYHLDSGRYFKQDTFDCNFGYRYSIFKSKLWQDAIITHVNFRFSKTPEFKTQYGAIMSEVEKLGELNQENLRQAIINIRSEKLPDPATIGNAGSFFKNPVISLSEYLRMKDNYEDLHAFKLPGEQYKIPAAFLIEKCGWKGFREGDAGVYPKQPLILVNYGKAPGFDIFNLARRITNSVAEKFGIELEMEVNLVN